MANEEILKLNVGEVIRDKAPQLYRFLPRFVIKWMERVICQDELNGILTRHANATGVDFATCVLEDLNIELHIEGADNIPTNGRFIFASNHPLGALDGIAMISYLGKRYCGDVKFLVNDILMNIEPLKDVFVPINKHGRQGRDVRNAMAEAFESNKQIFTFPAGLCSRNLRGSVIEDLKWQKGFITKSREYKRDIIPVYFEGYNSHFFYRLGKIRRRLGLKFNLEMIYLPSEIFKSRNKHFTIRFGTPIAWTELDSNRSAEDWALYVRTNVYKLGY